MAEANERIRAFFAVEVPGEVRDSLARVSAEFRAAYPNIKWVSPGNFHITLSFLGEVPTDVLERCGEAVGERLSEVPAFELSVVGFGAFPPRGAPRVVWAGIGGDGESVTVAYQACEAAARHAGIARRRERFHAHVTLGRIRKAAPRGLRKAIESAPAYSSHAFPVRNVSLFRSTLTSSGPVYEVIENFPLR